jgi:hypothetical protein
MRRRLEGVGEGTGHKKARKKGTNMSDNLVLNLNDVDEKAGGFEAMPKGDYEAIVDDVEFGDSSKGSPMITWKFKVTEEPYAKRTLFYYNVLDQTFGVAALKKTLIALGVDMDMSSFNPQEFADSGEAIGLPIKIKVGIQKYEGEKRNNVKDVSASSEGNDFMG